MGGLRLSKTHGVNPAVPRCFFCGEQKNQVILAGYIKGDRQAPQGAVWDHEPCDQCVEHMELGVVLVSVDEARSPDKDNPWRTGGWVVVSEDFIRRVVTPSKLADALIEGRFGFVPDQVWDAIGLPRGEVGSE